MARTVERMQKVFGNVQSFLWLITNASGVIFENINAAASNMLKVVVLDDFSRMLRVIKYCVSNYDKNHAPVVGGIQHSINWITHSESFPGNIRASNVIYRNSTLRYLQYILTIGTDSGRASRDDFVSRLIRRPDKWEHCRSRIMDFAVILGNLSVVETEISLANSRDKISYTISSLYDIPWDLFPCLLGLNAEMTRVDHVNERIQEAVQNILHFSMLFSYSRFLVDARNDISDLQETVIWFSKQMQLYAQNKTTKLDLSNNTTITQVQGVIDKIMTELGQNVIDRLLVLGGIFKKEVRKLYMKGLSGMMALDEYYDNGYIEDELRMLKIRAPSQYKDRLICVWRFPC